MIKGLENLPYKTEGVRSSLPGEEKVQGASHHSIPVLEGQLQREWKISFHKEPHG